VQINLSPVRSNATLLVSKLGDILAINGEAFDFSQLPEGATLPAEAIGSDHFAGPVERTNGELHLTLRLPHGPNPSQAVAFPQPITVTQDGPVELPV
jgi:hypothetical protein